MRTISSYALFFASWTTQFCLDRKANMHVTIRQFNVLQTREKVKFIVRWGRNADEFGVFHGHDRHHDVNETTHLPKGHFFANDEHILVISLTTLRKKEKRKGKC